MPIPRESPLVDWERGFDPRVVSTCGHTSEGTPCYSMKSPQRAIIALIMAMILGGGFACWRDREPSLHGKTLSQWIDKYYLLRTAGGPGAARDDSAKEAREAVLTIGTNAIPALLDRVRTRDSVLETRLMLWLWQKKLVQNGRPRSETTRNRADWGFSILGPLGEPAIPSLVTALTDQDPGVRATAARCLGHIGPKAESAIPAILPLLEERNLGKPILSAMDALREIHRRPDLVVPQMLAFLNGERASWNYSVPAIDVLRAYGADPAPALPAIKDFLNHPESDKRSAADSAITFIETRTNGP